MKKLIMLSAISIITLSSFTVQDTFKKPETAITWYYVCVDGSSGSFSCSFCTQSDAQGIANYKCSHN